MARGDRTTSGLGGLEFARVGSFRYYFQGDRWEWSDEVAGIHGYEPGTVEPTTDLMLAHKHPDDRDRVATALRRLRDHGIPFSSRHRIVDRFGTTRPVLVVGDRLYDESGTAIGATGFYVDLTDGDRQAKASLDAAVQEYARSRSRVEQAKGILMFVYKISDDRAFAVLKWRSQHTNTKIRDLAARFVHTITTTDIALDDTLRERVDRHLLTAHQPPKSAEHRRSD